MEHAENVHDSVAYVEPLLATPVSGFGAVYLRMRNQCALNDEVVRGYVVDAELRWAANADARQQVDRIMISSMVPNCGSWARESPLARS